MISAVVVSAFSQILLKTSAKKQHTSIFAEYLNLPVIGGYAMMVASTILVIMAYKGIDFKNGPVIESAGYVLILFLSRLFFHEKITWKKMVGNALIIAGIVVFNL